MTFTTITGSTHEVSRVPRPCDQCGDKPGQWRYLFKRAGVILCMGCIQAVYEADWEVKE